MNVSELIKNLRTMNPDAIVVVDGYEGNYNKLNVVSECRIDFSRENLDAALFGEYDIVDNGQGMPAVCLLHRTED